MNSINFPGMLIRRTTGVSEKRSGGGPALHLLYSSHGERLRGHVRPPSFIHQLFHNRRKGTASSGSSEAGHTYRVRNAIFDGHVRFDSAKKYGNKTRSDACQPNDEAYDAKRVRKKPSKR